MDLIPYLPALGAALLYSVQFTFTQYYRRECGGSLFATFLHTAGYNAVGFLVLFCIAGFRIRFTPLSFLFAALGGIDCIGYVYCSLRAFSRVNLSVYSLFSALGDLVLPSLAGLLFFREGVTPGKALCFILVAASLFLTVDREKTGSGRHTEYLYCTGVFVLSGMGGVLSKVHSSMPGEKVDAASFAMLNAAVAAAVSVVLLAVVCAKQTPEERAARPKLTARVLGSIAVYGAVNKVAFYLLLLGLAMLPATVQYPLLAAGNIVFPAFIALALRQKPTKKELLSLLLAILGIVVLTMI